MIEFPLPCLITGRFPVEKWLLLGGFSLLHPSISLPEPKFVRLFFTWYSFRVCGFPPTTLELREQDRGFSIKETLSIVVALSSEGFWSKPSLRQETPQVSDQFPLPFPWQVLEWMIKVLISGLLSWRIFPLRIMAMRNPLSSRNPWFDSQNGLGDKSRYNRTSVPFIVIRTHVLAFLSWVFDQ